ncbi:MAG: GNAT family N-acetyltransferase [Alphaproteobacteria bacterium]|nr:GNAT family N-acetyltransferase [Alphaproteobacteria bacterium]
MSLNRVTIRPLQSDDFGYWLPLWDGNNLGHRNEEVTTETWVRLCDPDNTQVNGLCAVMGDQLVGIVHYILHPTTGSVTPVCYMQDVYVDPNYRRKGIGKRLVQEVTKIGAQEKWGRMYWLTHNDNEDAKAMYANFGVKLDFTFYVLPMGKG